MAAPGAAIGAAAGGLHGALTNDPNNPNEGRVGRILSGALGGAAMGAGAGGAYGAGKAHVGNLTQLQSNKVECRDLSVVWPQELALQPLQSLSAMRSSLLFKTLLKALLIEGHSKQPSRLLLKKV